MGRLQACRKGAPFRSQRDLCILVALPMHRIWSNSCRMRPQKHRSNTPVPSYYHNNNNIDNGDWPATIYAIPWNGNGILMETMMDSIDQRQATTPMRNAPYITLGTIGVLRWAPCNLVWNVKVLSWAIIWRAICTMNNGYSQIASSPFLRL